MSSESCARGLELTTELQRTGTARPAEEYATPPVRRSSIRRGPRHGRQRADTGAVPPPACSRRLSQPSLSCDHGSSRWRLQQMASAWPHAFLSQEFVRSRASPLQATHRRLTAGQRSSRLELRSARCSVDKTRGRRFASHIHLHTDRVAKVGRCYEVGYDKLRHLHHGLHGVRVLQ